eukprot:Filipodium_phascolosomae@DN2903_c0_g1_i1.p1
MERETVLHSQLRASVAEKTTEIEKLKTQLKEVHKLENELMDMKHSNIRLQEQCDCLEESRSQLFEENQEWKAARQGLVQLHLSIPGFASVLRESPSATNQNKLSWNNLFRAVEYMKEQMSESQKVNKQQNCELREVQEEVSHLQHRLIESEEKCEKLRQKLISKGNVIK